MNNPGLVSMLCRIYVPTSICTKWKKSKKSIDLVIPHYIAPYSLAANIHICRAESKQRTRDDIDRISRLPRQDKEQHGGGSHFIMLILLICLDVKINVMDVVYCVAFGCNAISYRRGETSSQVLLPHSSNTT